MRWQSGIRRRYYKVYLTKWRLFSWKHYTLFSSTHYLLLALLPRIVLTPYYRFFFIVSSTFLHLNSWIGSFMLPGTVTLRKNNLFVPTDIIFSYITKDLHLQLPFWRSDDVVSEWSKNHVLALLLAVHGSNQWQQWRTES